MRPLISLAMSTYSACVLAEDSRDIAFTNLQQGWKSGVAHTSIVQIYDKSSWEELWLTRDHGGVTGELPPVNFDTHFVVAFYLGSRPSGGYSVEINRIVASTGTATLHVTETTPGKRCVVITAVATPYHYVAVATQSEWVPLDFSLARVVNECP
jgi:hypothetical protein